MACENCQQFLDIWIYECEWRIVESSDFLLEINVSRLWETSISDICCWNEGVNRKWYEQCWGMLVLLIHMAFRWEIGFVGWINKYFEFIDQVRWV